MSLLNIPTRRPVPNMTQKCHKFDANTLPSLVATTKPQKTPLEGVGIVRKGEEHEEQYITSKFFNFSGLTRVFCTLEAFHRGCLLKIPGFSKRRLIFLTFRKFQDLTWLSGRASDIESCTSLTSKFTVSKVKKIQI